ncbi:hypothetical protein ACFL2Q_03090 [Thermodesulfobacteriota bacterium]
MLQNKDILVIGARPGGYGASIAKAAIRAGARVFGTSLQPEKAGEKKFFEELGATLVSVPLRYDFENRGRVFDQITGIERQLKDHGVTKLKAVVHAVAGGFPRQPAVMKAVTDILKGEQDFSDLATAVKRNVYYVNAGSFDDTVEGLSPLIDEETCLMALTYRGNLPYFIGPTKRYLEKLSRRMARKGKRSLIAALPEAWTQSSQFFTGIEIAVMHNYFDDLADGTGLADEVSPAYAAMKESLARIEGLDPLFDELRTFIAGRWSTINPSTDRAVIFGIATELLGRFRKEGSFPILRRAVEAVSEFVREASSLIVVRDLIAEGLHEPGDVRQVHYRDLKGTTAIGTAKPLEKKKRPPARIRKFTTIEREEIQSVLNMYGDNFLFLDRVVVESGELHDGSIGFATFTVPTPEENPLMKDHFIGMPLFGGHLQMEAVAQFGTFIVMRHLKDKGLVPIHTGTEFPNLNTMAPPGEKLTMMAKLFAPDRRRLRFDVFIENRFARSKGTVRGMMVSRRILNKMVGAFAGDSSE